MSKRLVMLASAMTRAGVGILIVELATRLQERDWGVDILSLVSPEAFPDYVPEIEALAEYGIRFDHLGVSRGIANPRAILKLASIIRRWEPDILHSHSVPANLIARITRPLMPRSLISVSTIHNVWEGRRWREIAYRVTDPLCDITTNVCQAGADRFVRVGAVPAHRIRVVPNGVDFQKFQFDPAARVRLRQELNLGKRFTWIAVGRIEKQKDYSNMIRAFAQIQMHSANPTLLIVGDGALREATKALARTLGVVEQIRFLGVRDDVPQLLCAADAYVMSSAWEGMPLVLLEAAGTGLPVVATNVGGNQEIMIEGQTGYLPPARDADALARDMARIMNLPPEERKAMGEAARQFAISHHDIEHVVGIWENLYNELHKKRTSR